MKRRSESLVFTTEANEDGITIALYRTVGLARVGMDAGILRADRVSHERWESDELGPSCLRDLRELAQTSEVSVLERPYVVRESHVDRDLRNMGLGAWMYAEAARLAWRSRAAIVGDECDRGETSIDARSVWGGASLARYARTSGLVALWNAGSGHRTVSKPRGVRLIRLPRLPETRSNPSAETASADELQRAMGVIGHPQRRAHPGGAMGAVTIRVMEHATAAEDEGDDHLVASMFAYDAAGHEIGRVSLASLADPLERPCVAAYRSIEARHPASRGREPLVVVEAYVDRAWRGLGLGIELYATAAWYAASSYRRAIAAHVCAGDQTKDGAVAVWRHERFSRHVDVDGFVGYWRGGKPLGPERTVTLATGGRRTNPPGDVDSTEELQRAMEAAREAPYRPQDGATAVGEWDRSSGEPRWRQSHRELVVGALRTWKGAPSELRLHLIDEDLGAPQPDSGSGKIMRARAGALLWELAHNARPATRVLYRGSHLLPEGPQSWSESRKVAELWASKNGGRVFTRAKGEPALRVMDYTSSAFNEEREWLAVGQGGAVDRRQNPPAINLLSGRRYVVRQLQKRFGGAVSDDSLSDVIHELSHWAAMGMSTADIPDSYSAFTRAVGMEIERRSSGQRSERVLVTEELRAVAANGVIYELLGVKGRETSGLFGRVMQGLGIEVDTDRAWQRVEAYGRQKTLRSSCAGVVAWIQDA